MKKYFRSLSGDNLFILISITMIVSFSIALIVDFNTTTSHANKKIIGNILYKHNVVRRKHDAQIIWNDLAQNNILYNRDTILTEKDSETIVSLSGGALLEFSEVSMVLLDISKETTTIDLTRGSIFIKRENKDNKNAPSKFKTEDKNIIIKDGNILLSRLKEKGVSLFVQEGNVSIESNGEIHRVKRGEMALISKPIIKIESKPIMLVYPSNNKRLIISNKVTNVDFHWENIGKKKINFYLFLISRNRDFKDSFKRLSLRTNKIRVPLPEGIYYWKVLKSDINTDLLEAETFRKISIIREPPLHLLNPDNGSVIEYKLNVPDISFSWQKNDYADLYRLDISTNKNFSNIVISIKTHVTHFIYKWDIQIPEESTYYWRIKSINSVPGWPEQISLPYNFSIKRNKSISASHLIYPENNQRISWSHFERGGIIFQWSKNSEVRKTVLYISRDTNFKNILYTFSTGSNYLFFKKPLKRGKYYWRVKEFNAIGKGMGFSDTFSFVSSENHDIELIRPFNNSKFEYYEVSGKGIQFQWKKPETYGQLLFELSTDNKFESIMISKKIYSYSIVIPNINPGNYFWRVKLLDGNTIELETSKIRKILITNNLAAPDLHYPVNGHIVDISKKNNINLSWSKTRGANYYEINLFQIVTRKATSKYNTIISARTEQLNYQISDLKRIAIGPYYWTVRALTIDKNNNILCESKIVKQRFSVGLVGLADSSEKTTSKIKIISPSKQLVK